MSRYVATHRLHVDQLRRNEMAALLTNAARNAKPVSEPSYVSVLTVIVIFVGGALAVVL